MRRLFDVYLNETLVGYLSEGDNYQIAFRFDADYIALPNRPVLSQSFEDDLYKTYKGKKTGRLPNFFSNLIPEKGDLRDLIERNLGETDDLSILEAVGGDLPGAVIVKRSAEDGLDFPEDDTDEAADSKDEAADSVIEEAVSKLAFRFSLAGVQLKFSVNRERDRLTLPVSGRDGEWIVKIDSKSYPNLVENEYVMMKWAEASGFEVPDCYIDDAAILDPGLSKITGSQSRVFVIRRYDRRENRRIHQEDFNQVVRQRPELKYDHISYEKIAILAVNIIGEEGYYEYIKRLALMVASGNTDLHLKNWSLIYPDGVNARWTPLYDQVFVMAWKHPGLQLALEFCGRHYIKQVDEGAFERLAAKAGMDASATVRVVRETLKEIRSAWQNLEARRYFPQAHLFGLKEYWAEAPLLKGLAPLE